MECGHFKLYGAINNYRPRVITCVCQECGEVVDKKMGSSNLEIDGYSKAWEGNLYDGFSYMYRRKK